MMNKKRFIGLVIIMLIVLLLAVILAFRFVQGKECSDKACFDEYMETCRRAHYINEETEASWDYRIVGKKREGCSIEVTLLQAKEGDLELRNYEGHAMTCAYDLGETAFPEKDLSKCHGLLKEDLQTILIKNLHAYIVDNLDDIKDDLLNQ